MIVIDMTFEFLKMIQSNRTFFKVNIIATLILSMTIVTSSIWFVVDGVNSGLLVVIFLLSVILVLVFI